jgi:hypothetical protein
MNNVSLLLPDMPHPGSFVAQKEGLLRTTKRGVPPSVVLSPSRFSLLEAIQNQNRDGGRIRGGEKRTNNDKRNMEKEHEKKNQTADHVLPDFL